MLSLPDKDVLLLGHAQDDVRRRVEAVRLQQSLDGSPDTKRENNLREASQDFEAIFLHQLLKQMRATVPKNDLLHSKAEDFWQSHFDMEMATVMARGGGIGLAEMIYEQLRQSQVQATKSSDPVGKPLGMTILAPVQTNPPRSNQEDFTADQNAPQDVAHPLKGSKHLPHSMSQAGAPYPDAVHIPGASSTMTLVRSLARSIEERGGVVTEHPGFVDGSDPVHKPARTSPVLPPMQWPLEGRVSSGFGWRPDPFTGEQAWHSGVDLVASKGTPIGAAWDGRVVFVGQRGGYGNMVVLEHAGGWRSYYAHNDQNSVMVGDKVQAGQRIATVGSSGRSTGPHLHFEVRQGSMAWDPKQIRDRLNAGLSIGKSKSA